MYMLLQSSNSAAMSHTLFARSQNDAGVGAYVDAAGAGAARAQAAARFGGEGWRLDFVGAHAMAGREQTEGRAKIA